MNEDNQEIEINLDDENENIDVNEENFIYVNIPEETIEEMQEDIEELKTDIQGKVDKVAGKGLSTEDYTTAEKNKLANLENYDDTEVKESISDLEAKHDEEVLELNKEITDLHKELDITEDLMAPGEAHGTNITINDSERYPFKEIVFNGKSEQETFTGKNKLQVSATSQTINGIAYTINEDGTIKANGTATAQSQLNMGTFNFEANTSYILNGCPAGGSTSTYRQIISGGSSEYGEGVSVSYTEDTEASIYIRIMSGVTVNNLVFKPMIRLASIADATFEKYVGGQQAPRPDYECPIQNVGDNINIFDKSSTPIYKDQVETQEIETGVRVATQNTGTYHIALYLLDTVASLKGKEITVSANIVPSSSNLGGLGIILCDADGSNRTAIAQKNSITGKQTLTAKIDESYDDNKVIALRLYSNLASAEAGDYIDYEELKAEEGTEATPYSPYNCGNVEVKVENRNLISYFGYGKVPSNVSGQIVEAYGYRTEFIEIDNSKEYIWSYNAVSTYAIYVLYYDENKNYLGFRSNTNIISNSEYYAKAKYIKLRMDCSDGNTSNWQLEEGSTATDYVPHEEQTAIFPLEEGQILHASDTIEDKIVQKRGTRVLNGSENWQSSGDGNNTYRFALAVTEFASGKEGYCNRNKWVTSGVSSDEQVVGIISSTLYFRINKAIISSLEGNNNLAKFKTWLATNNVIFEAELAEPLEIPFTENQAKAKKEIDKLYSYKNITHITSEADLDVIYRKQSSIKDEDLQNQIDSLKDRVETLEEKVEAQENLIPTGDASGSDITLSDSARYYFKKIVPGGKSEQETFTGKNKFYIPNTNSRTINGVTINYNSNNSKVIVNGTATGTISDSFSIEPIVLEAGTYTASIKGLNVISTNADRIFLKNNDTSAIIVNSIKDATPQTFTLTETTNVVPVFIIASGSAYSNKEIKIQIEQGSTATAYEPYTGGQPAPNPDYECPIKNVTGNVEVKVETKNSFTGWTKGKGLNSTTGAEIINASAAVSDYISVDFETNPNYIMSGLDVNLYNIVAVYNSNKEFLGRTAGSRVEKRILTKDIFTAGTAQGTGDISYLRSTEYEVSGQTGSIDNVDNLKTQLEEGSTVTDYVPHEEQTAIFPLEEGQRLHKDDAIRDKIVQKRKTVVLDGTEEWVLTNAEVGQFRLAINDMTKNPILCNYFGYKLTYSANGKPYLRPAGGAIFAEIGTEMLDEITVNAWKAWLAEKYANNTPVTVEYELAEPLEIPFTENQAKAKKEIDKLYSYKNITHITSEADLDVIYRKQSSIKDEDLQNQIDSLKDRVETLEEKVEAQEDLIPTGDASGSNITLSDSARYYFKKMVPGGKSEQETFTGKNIVKSLYYRGASTLNFYINEKKVVSSMIISGITNVSVNNMTVYLKFGNVTYTLATFNMVANQKFNVSITLTEEQINAIKEAENVYIQLYRPSASSADLSTCTYDEMMLRDSSTTDTYEKYVGGQPAPSSIYECPIHNVTGNVEVKVENKNKLKGLSTPKTDSDYWQIVYSGNNFTPLEDGWGKFEYNNANGSTTVFINAKVKLNAVNLKPNTQYTIVTEIRNANFSSSGAYFQVFTNNADSVFTTNKNYSTNGIFKVLATTKESFEGIINSLDSYLRIGAGTSATAEVRLSVFEGDVDITNFTYIEHEEQTAIFPLEEGQRLHKNDVVNFIEDKIVQKRKTLVIDITKFSFRALSNGILMLTNIRSQIGYYKNINGLCSHFVNANNEQINSNDSATTYLQDGQFNFRAGNSDSEKDRIYFKDSSNETLEDWVSFFTNNTVVLEYVLNEPIETPFTEAQRTAKAQIDKLYSYKGTTHITSNANLDVTYRKDLETIIDNLSNAIVAQGGI